MTLAQSPDRAAALGGAAADTSGHSPALIEAIGQAVGERLMRYVRLDTTSDASSDTVPSTPGQLELSRQLADELRALGCPRVTLDDKGYLYGHIPATPGFGQAPAIAFLAHVDTSPDCPGAGVVPILHPPYQGGLIPLPNPGPGGEPIVLDPAVQTGLARQIGARLITASGDTLLGADNKCGVAAVMTLAEVLLSDRLRPAGLEHGPISLLFTPDEEIGRGADHVDIGLLGAEFGYTLDGETPGTLETETWTAFSATVYLMGQAAHPGAAYGKLVNALKVAASVIGHLPADQAPETTRDRAGFLHVTGLSGNALEARIDLILRDFTQAGLDDKLSLLEGALAKALTAFPGAQGHITHREQYRNMGEILAQHPHVVDRALAAITRCGLEARTEAVRGGTDGARLSFMGLPCPNLFVGEHDFHSPYEWTSIEDMTLAVRCALEICRA